MPHAVNSSERRVWLPSAPPRIRVDAQIQAERTDGADREFEEGRRISLIEIAESTGIGRITLSRMLNRGTHVRSTPWIGYATILVPDRSVGAAPP